MSLPAPRAGRARSGVRDAASSTSGSRAGALVGHARHGAAMSSSRALVIAAPGPACWCSSPNEDLLGRVAAVERRAVCRRRLLWDASRHPRPPKSLPSEAFAAFCGASSGGFWHRPTRKPRPRSRPEATPSSTSSPAGASPTSSTSKTSSTTPSPSASRSRVPWTRMLHARWADHGPYRSRACGLALVFQVWTHLKARAAFDDNRRRAIAVRRVSGAQTTICGRRRGHDQEVARDSLLFASMHLAQLRAPAAAELDESSSGRNPARMERGCSSLTCRRLHRAPVTPAADEQREPRGAVGSRLFLGGSEVSADHRA